MTTVDLGAMIAQLSEIRDRRRELAAEEKDLVEKYETLKTAFVQRMEEEGCTRISSKEGTVILTETIVPQVNDRDAMGQWILETGNIYLLQNRVNSAAYRELVEAGQEVPGVTPFTKKDVSLRST